MNRYKSLLSLNNKVRVIIFSLLYSAHISANVAERYGYGSSSAALGGIGGASLSEGFSATPFSPYLNPGAIGSIPDNRRLQFGISFLNYTPSMLSIDNVVIENDFTSDRVTHGKVTTDYRSTQGYVLGSTVRLFPQFFNFSMGASAYLPLSQLAYIDTGENFVPEYVLFRARNHRPQIDFGMSADPIEGVGIGIGAHVSYSLTSSGNIFLQTAPNKPSTMRFAASMKPKATPYFGIWIAPNLSSGRIKNIFTLSAVTRLASESPTYMNFKSGARAFGSFAALDFNFTGNSVLYYDPLAVELGGSIQYTPWTRLFFEADYERWSLFKTPALIIDNSSTESCSGASCGIQISNGFAPSYALQDTWTYKLAHALTLGDQQVNIGFSYRPSIFSALPSGAGNLVDVTKRGYHAGYQIKFNHLFTSENPVTLAGHLAYYQFKTEQVTKSDGNEQGTLSGPLKIGAPGYTIGGKEIGGGISVSVAY